MKLTLSTAGDPQRSAVERFIHQTFAVQYGADVRHYLPWLLAIENQSGELQGVLGVQGGADGALFLEQYLEQPVETVIAAAAGATVVRDSVVEVGNLSARSAGGARLLIVMLTAFLQGADYQWVTFTALPSLINSFRRLGIPLYPLVDAEPERLQGEAASWGSYYEGQPKVVAAQVSEGFKALERASMAERLQMALIWSEAYRSGTELRMVQLDTVS